MTWAHSLIKLTTYEVEVLQKRLAEIAGRRADAEMRLTLLVAEGQAEARHADTDAEAGWYHIGFADGLRRRKAAILQEIEQIALEEQGARDVLGQAFESQKKYEQIAENQRLAQVKEAARQETAAMDELGLRRAVGAR